MDICEKLGIEGRYFYVSPKFCEMYARVNRVTEISLYGCLKFCEMLWLEGRNFDAYTSGGSAF